MSSSAQNKVHVTLLFLCAEDHSRPSSFPNLATLLRAHFTQCSTALFTLAHSALMMHNTVIKGNCWDITAKASEKLTRLLICRATVSAQQLPDSPSHVRRRSEVKT